MKNLNYPTWESGIPQLLPEINPYSHSKWENNWCKEDEPDATEIVLLPEWSDEYIIIRQVFSYMEILQWLRDKGYHIELKWIFTDTGGYYNWEVYKEDKWLSSFYQFTYHEALDEAIIYTLNLLKDE